MIPINAIRNPLVWDKFGRFTFDVLDSKFFYQSRWEYARGECTTENLIEFCVKTTNAHILEFEVRGEDGIGRSSAFCEYRDQ